MPLAPETIDRVLALIADDLTYGDIGKRLGITRSSVSGIVDRARKSGRLPPSTSCYGTRRERLEKRLAVGREPAESPKPPKPKPPRVAPPPLPVPLPLRPQPEPRPDPAAARGVPAAVMALMPAHCRWPIGDPSDPAFRFCCAPVVDDPGPIPSMRRRYCAAHLAAASAKPDAGHARRAA